MHSLIRGDKRAVNLSVYWLKDRTVFEEQSFALKYALKRLTDKDYEDDKEWVEWYYEGPGEKLYPEPNFDKWYEEINSQYKHLVISSK